MKKTNMTRVLVSALTLQTFLLSPTVHADSISSGFHERCDKVLAGEIPPGADTAKQQQLTLDCTKAHDGVEAHNAEKVKTIAYGVAAALDWAGFAIEDLEPYGEAIAKPLCIGATLAGSATGMLEDKNAASSISKITKDAIVNIQPILDGFIGVFALKSAGSYASESGLLNFAKGAGKSSKSAAKSASKGSNENESNCLFPAVLMSAQTALSTYAWSTIDKAVKDNVFSAIDNEKNTLALGSNNLTGSSINNTDPVVPKKEGPGTPKSSTCDQQPGDAMLTCVNDKYPSPEMSAITNNPAFLANAQKALGKSLGDFAKGFSGDAKDAANYVAGGMGLPPGAAASLSDAMKAGDKVAKDNGVEGKYTPMTYASSGGKAAAGGDPDFGKLMGDMLKTLNPDDPNAKGKDPSELVFRQLDLLPPDKIAENKNISLFARIGYRYRKKTGDVEQLNWALEQNQQSVSRAPASAPLTQPTK